MKLSQRKACGRWLTCDGYDSDGLGARSDFKVARGLYAVWVWINGSQPQPLVVVMVLVQKLYVEGVLEGIP